MFIASFRRKFQESADKRHEKYNKRFLKTGTREVLGLILWFWNEDVWVKKKKGGGGVYICRSSGGALAREFTA